jgi:DNA-binding NtrC family response regulator
MEKLDRLLLAMEQHHTAMLQSIAALRADLGADRQAPAAPTDLNKKVRERKAVLYALEFFKGNRKKAAESLGMSERTLYRKIKDYAVDTTT